MGKRAELTIGEAVSVIGVETVGMMRSLIVANYPLWLRVRMTQMMNI